MKTSIVISLMLIGLMVAITCPNLWLFLNRIMLGKLLLVLIIVYLANMNLCLGLLAAFGWVMWLRQHPDVIEGLTTEQKRKQKPESKPTNISATMVDLSDTIRPVESKKIPVDITLNSSVEASPSESFVKSKKFKLNQ